MSLPSLTNTSVFKLRKRMCQQHITGFPYVTVRHLGEVCQYITDRNDISKWRIEMLGNGRFAVVWCFTGMGGGGSPVGNKRAVVPVEAVKLESI